MSIEIVIVKLVCNHCGKTLENRDGVLEYFSDCWYVDLDNDYAECPECAAKLKALTEGL